jgi:RNA polymerase sigma-70 factor (ECF subfamily)
MAVPSDEQRLLDLLRAGDEKAAREVFAAYANRLLQLARARLSQRLARRVDPEDIVQSVFRTFFSRAKAGHFTVEEHDDLAKILISITVRKTLRQVAFQKAAKRDFGLEQDPGDSGVADNPELSTLEPSPEATVAFVDQLDHLLARLRPGDRTILEMRLQGYRNEEIAREMGISDRHVRRVLKHIRAIAEEEDLGR